jgi:hypothetical protein
MGIRHADHLAPSIAKVGNNFDDKRGFLGRYCSFAGSGHGDCFFESNHHLRRLQPTVNLGLFHDWSPLVLIQWLSSPVSNALFSSPATESSHLSAGLPTRRVLSGLCTVHFLHSTEVSQPSQSPYFDHFHCTLLGPYILLNILLSNIQSAFLSSLCKGRLPLP